MFLTFKQNQSAIVPVSLVNSSNGLPMAAQAAASVTCTVVKADGSTATVSVTGANWTELTAGNTSASGEYLLTLPSSVTNLEGALHYYVSVTGSDLYRGTIAITADLNSDLASLINNVLAAVNAVTTTVNTINTNVSAVEAKTNNLPASPASTTDVTNAVTSIKGSAGVDNTMLAGTGFDTTQHSLAVIAGQILARVLGMLHENSVLDQTTFDGNNNLTSGRLRLYNSKANADAATAASPGTYNTGLVAQYSITATYTGTNLQTYEVARVA